jgi:putative lipoic acid-binding regulatory protein
MLVPITLFLMLIASSTSYILLQPRNRLCHREVRMLSKLMGSDPSNPSKPSLGFGKAQPKIISNLSVDQLLRQNKYQKLKDEYTSKQKGSRVFDDHLAFPCDFTVKIIGENDESGALVRDMVSKVASIVDTTVDNVKHSVRDSSAASSSSNSQQIPTGRAKYISLTIVTRFQNSNQLYAVYDLVSDPRVKYVI